jgi:ribonuclease BN (tRNA processing enzyme)
MNNQVANTPNVFRSAEICADPGPPRWLAPASARSVAIMLGSGKPEPTIHRYGPAGAVVANNMSYIIDAGEGIWRAIARAATTHECRLIDALAPQNLTRVFVTHFHSDHTVGLASLVLLPWTCGRTSPIEVYGPVGTDNLVSKLLEAYSADIRERVHGPEQKDDMGWRAIASEIAEPGMVYSDENVEVHAFHHPHGGFRQNLGYRFVTQDRTFVWGGDGIASPSFLEAAADADVLFSDVSPDTEDLADTPWRGADKELARSFHMSSRTLGEMATQAAVKTLVLHHEQNYFAGSYELDALVRDVKQRYSGQVFSARDGDVY